MKLAILFLSFIITSGFSQSTILDSIENHLVKSRQHFIDSAFNYNDYSWYLANKFNSELKTSLVKHPSTFDHPFDSLQKRMVIIMSEDSLLKTYSWYCTYGGSWHDIASIVQFKAINIDTINLSRDEGGGGPGACTDASYFKIQILKHENEKIYLLTGWGTHGGGTHHKTMRAFKIENQKLVELDSIFDGEKRLCIQTPRVIQDIVLTYNEKSQTISYELNDWNDETKKLESDKITIYWDGHKFTSNKK